MRAISPSGILLLAGIRYLGYRLKSALQPEKTAESELKEKLQGINLQTKEVEFAACLKEIRKRCSFSG